MPKMGRVLSFRARETSASLAWGEIQDVAKEFLATAQSDRLDETWERLGNADILTGVLAILRADLDAAPSPVSEEAVRIYGWLSSPGRRVGVFDETDYFLGEFALVAGHCFRHLGQYEEAQRWLDRADGSFRHTVDPGPHSSRVAYAKLAIRYDMHQFDRVLEDLPSVVRSFERLSMTPELRKARFLEAMALKQGARFAEALNAFQALRSDLLDGGQPSCSSLLGIVLIEIGSEYGRAGELEQAVASYQEASRHVTEPMNLAHLKGSIAETYRDLGKYALAIDSYRSAMTIFAQLGMKQRLAYYRVITAETLLRADRAKEAEWEIRAALPIIQERLLVREGAAALAVLQESLKRRRLAGC